MLVLSRRPEEQILLPTVPALIKIISSNASLVRLGFEAPTDVPILREELTRNRDLSLASSEDEAGAQPTRPVFRNRLNNLTLGVMMLRVQLADCDPVVRETLADIEKELKALRCGVRGPSREAVVA